MSRSYSLDVTKFIRLNTEKSKYNCLQDIIDRHRESKTNLEKSKILKWFYQIACLNTTDLDQINFNPSHFFVDDLDDIVLLPNESEIHEYNNIHDCWAVACTLYQLVTLKPLIDLNQDLESQMIQIEQKIETIHSDFELFKEFLRKMLLYECSDRLTAKELLNNIPKTSYLISSIGFEIKLINIFEEKPTLSLTSHSDNVLSLVVFNGCFLATGSKDKTIKIWNLNINQVVQTLNGHTDSVNCLLYSNEISLISGSNNGVIKIWDMDNKGLNISTFTDHIAGILDLIELTFDSFASCSIDKTIRIWNKDGLIKILTNHSEEVSSLTLIQQSKFVSSSADKTINVWNKNTFELITSFNDEQNGTSWEVNLKKMSDDYFVSLSSDGRIRIWSLDENNCLNSQLIGNEIRFKKMIRLSDVFLVCITLDNLVQIWNIKTNSLVKKLMNSHDLDKMIIYPNFF